MTFGAPYWLWGLAAVPLLLLVLGVSARRRRRKWLLFARDETRERISLATPASAALSALLLALAVASIFLAMARPRWGLSEETMKTRGLDLVIAIDLSNSMLAEDVSPSRLVVARAIARELASRLPSDRVGLVGFAGSAATLCPLTLDRGALELFLGAADPGVFPAQGTDLGAAIDAARELLLRHGLARRSVVLLTDGEDQERTAERAAEKARADAVTIYAIGIGTDSGAPIPDRDEQGRVRDYRRGPSGEAVTTRLDEEILRRIAETTGGAYARASGFGGGLEQVVSSIARLERDELTDVLPRRHMERYRWPLGVALLAALGEAALVTRRKKDAP